MTDTKDTSIVTPSPIKGLNLSEAVFAPMDSSGLGLRAHLSALGFSQRRTPQGRLFHKDGRAVHLGCIGAPAAVLALEPLLITGVRRILILGFCGALTERHEIGDAVA